MRHKCLAVFIIFLLDLTLTTFICFQALKSSINPKVLTKTLSESKIYENLPKFVETLYAQDQEADLQTKILVIGFAKSIDPQTVKAEVEKNTQPFFDFLNNRKKTLDVTFDLTLFKQNLEKNLPSALSDEITNLPTCAPGLQPNYEQANSLPTCIAQGTTPEQVQQALKTSGYVKEIISEVPDTFSLAEIKNIDKTFANARLSLKILNVIYLASLIISLILIGLLILLGRGWWPSILRWVGWGLVWPSVSLLLVFVLFKALPQILISQMTSGLNSTVVGFISPLMISFNNNIFRTSFIFSLVIFILGVILIILSYALPHPPEPKPPVKQQPPAPAPKPTK